MAVYTWSGPISATGGYIRLVRSDNGTSWSAPVTLSTSTSVQGAWPAVALNGDVYVAWLRWTTGDLMSFEIVRSTNGGSVVHSGDEPAQQRSGAA